MHFLQINQPPFFVDLMEFSSVGEVLSVKYYQQLLPSKIPQAAHCCIQYSERI